MKCFVVVFTLAVVALVAEGKALLTMYNPSDYYFKRSGEAAMPPKFNVKLVGTNTGRYPDPDFVPYQKYVACVSRAFTFEDCTLCYCTDLPNLALCWDYEGEQCQMTQSLVDAHRRAKNNNPSAGTWS